MLSKKYLIFIAIIGSLFLVFFYLNNRISTVENQLKSITGLPAPKTEPVPLPIKPTSRKEDSPMTITYFSDKNGDTNEVRYNTLTATEIRNITKDFTVGQDDTVFDSPDLDALVEELSSSEVCE